MKGYARHAHRGALAAWILLAASIAAWPLGQQGAVRWLAVIAFLPLLLPVAGIVRGSIGALRAAPLALAPALALALTEFLVNPPLRTRVGASLAFIVAAFLAVVAAIRARERGDSHL
jgi:uncharacterized membrane protein